MKFKSKDLDFATLILLIISAFILVTYLVLSIWYLQNDHKALPFKTISQAERLYCLSDDDCTTDDACPCMCPEAVNKKHKTKKSCDPSTVLIGDCALYCKYQIPRCIDKKCVLVERIIEEMLPKELDYQLVTFKASLPAFEYEHPILVDGGDKKQTVISTPWGQGLMIADRYPECMYMEVTGVIRYIAPRGTVGKDSYEGFYVEAINWQCLEDF